LAQLFISILLTVATLQITPVAWALDPVREDAPSAESGLTLAFKHFPRPGAVPVLLIHGLAQNDRGWDSEVERLSFARFLHGQGLDVWIGNLRGAGTPGFRSDTPTGPHHWTADDYAAYDVPALVRAVQTKTGIAPFLIGHSLGAWAIEGYLAGVSFDREGHLVPSRALSLTRQSRIQGVISIAGVYNLRWEHSVSDARRNPLREALDFYRSNYELELLAKVKPLYQVVPQLDSLPLAWIGRFLNLPLARIPYIGSRLASFYEGFQHAVIETPLLSMFYYAPNSDPDMVRLHARDGLEDLGPHLIEQLANTINSGETLSYYHLKRPDGTYAYADVRAKMTVPTLFIAGERDRLASALEIYEDGYLKTQPIAGVDKEFISVPDAGHLDILNGASSPERVMIPVARWVARHAEVRRL
jgi:pimeloyl-ACP methyl ester carboxylesterase